jgi:hypothetical protein
MKKIALFVMFSVSFIFCHSQTPIPYLKENEKFIYVDSVSMKPIFSQEYSAATLFFGNFASFQNDINGKWGVLNKSGKVVIEPKFIGPVVFLNGLTAAYLNPGDKTLAFVDTTGKIINEPWVTEEKINNYRSSFIDLSVQYFWNGSKLGLKNSKGKILLPAKFAKGGDYYKGGLYEMAYNLDGNFFYVDKNGKEFREKNIKATTGDDCPPNFKRISANDVTGTARKYKAVNGNYYYEVVLTVKPKAPTATSVKKIEAIKMTKIVDRAYGEEVRKTGFYVDASSGTFKFSGCTEKDVYSIEGSYKCVLPGFKGPSAYIYFRDLKIIQ